MNPWPKTTLPGSEYGRWAVITGASDGIGKAFAGQLAEAGFNLVVASRRHDELQRLSNDLSKAHDVAVRVVACDLATPEGIGQLERETAALDVGMFIACAGFGTSGPFVESELRVELDMLDVNCRAVVALTHSFANRLVARGGGGLVLLSSLVAFQGVPRAANYAATKAYVQTLAEGLHVELKPLGVDVLAVALGPVESGFARRADMVLGPAQSPGEVARGALRSLGSSVTVRPGFLAKFLEWSLKPLPRWGRVRMMGIVMAGMTRHQRPLSQ